MSQTSRHKPSGNRQALLEGALHCLQERGYARTTARDIVAASETNLGAIGYHYGSTEQLLTQALLTGFERWFDELAQATATVAEGERPLVAVARELPRTFERNRPLARAFIEAVAQAEHSLEICDGLRSCYERGHELLRAVVGEGPDADAVSSLLLAVFDGLLIQWLIGADRAAGSEELVRIGMALSDAAQGTGPAPAGDGADPQLRLNHITLAASDVERSARFYTRLGLTQIVADYPTYARFVAPQGDTTLSLHQAQDGSSERSTSIHFEVDDVDRTVDRLKQAGFGFACDPVDQPYLWREAILLDPDGHRIFIYRAAENRLNPPWRLPPPSEGKR